MNEKKKKEAVDKSAAGTVIYFIFTAIF